MKIKHPKRLFTLTSVLSFVVLLIPTLIELPSLHKEASEADKAFGKIKGEFNSANEKVAYLEDSLTSAMQNFTDALASANAFPEYAIRLEGGRCRDFLRANRSSPADPNKLLKEVGIDVSLAPADTTVKEKRYFHNTCSGTPHYDKYTTTHYVGPFWLYNLLSLWHEFLHTFASGLVGVHQRYLFVNATVETNAGPVTRASRCGDRFQTITKTSTLQTASVAESLVPSSQSEDSFPELDSLKDSAWAVVEKLKQLCETAIENARIYDANWLRQMANTLNETVIPNLRNQLASAQNETARLKPLIGPAKAKKEKADAAYNEGLKRYLLPLFLVPFVAIPVLYFLFKCATCRSAGKEARSINGENYPTYSAL